MNIGCSYNLWSSPRVLASFLGIVDNPDATLTVGNLSGGSFWINISAPAEYAGTYYHDTEIRGLSTALLDAGPVCIVAPVISGASSVGGVLSVAPGLWIFDGANPRPNVAYQWARNGNPINGETGTSFTVTGTEQSADITVTEHAVGAASTRMADSNAISILAPGSLTVSFISTGAISSTGMGPYTIPNMPIGATHTARKVIAVIGNGFDGSTGLTGVVIGGVVATPLVTAMANKFSNLSIWQAAVPFGTVADVSIAMGSDFRGCHVSLYRIIGGNPGAMSSDNSPRQFPQDLTLNVSGGSAVIAGIAVRNTLGGSVSWAGLSEDNSGFSWNNLLVSAASQVVSTTQTPKSIIATPTAGPQETCAAAVVINPT